jgi:hypothetical protein
MLTTASDAYGLDGAGRASAPIAAPAKAASTTVIVAHPGAKSLFTPLGMRSALLAYREARLRSFACASRAMSSMIGGRSLRRNILT